MSTRVCEEEKKEKCGTHQRWCGEENKVGKMATPDRNVVKLEQILQYLSYEEIILSL